MNYGLIDLVDRSKYRYATKEQRWEEELNELFKWRHEKTFDAIGERDDNWSLEWSKYGE